MAQEDKIKEVDSDKNKIYQLCVNVKTNNSLRINLFTRYSNNE
jgi:hypothetical protein